jgi:hypothetical protein
VKGQGSLRGGGDGVDQMGHRALDERAGAVHAMEYRTLIKTIWNAPITKT